MIIQNVHMPLKVTNHQQLFNLGVTPHIQQVPTQSVHKVLNELRVWRIGLI